MFRHTLIALTIAGCTLNSSVVAHETITNEASDTFYKLAKIEMRRGDVCALPFSLAFVGTLVGIFGIINPTDPVPKNMAMIMGLSATALLALVEGMNAYKFSRKLSKFAHKLKQSSYCY